MLVQTTEISAIIAYMAKRRGGTLMEEQRQKHFIHLLGREQLRAEVRFITQREKGGVMP